MVFDPNQPYNDLPPLPPKADLETKQVLKKTVSAGRALAELKGLGQTIPNQAMLVNTLVLQEAKASSAIENIVTTNDVLFKALASNIAHIDPMAKEVIRYREAVWHGYNAMKKDSRLSTDLFIQMVQIIKENTASIRNRPGTYIGNPHTRRVVFTPPEGEDVIRRKLKDLEDFIQKADTADALVKLALIHYQFEAIHPFSDGNGRTGRIINILYLVQQGLLELPVLYLSKFIIDQKNDYYRLLRDVTEQGAWEDWVLYMLEAVETTAINTRNRIVDIRALLDETLVRAKKELPAKVYSKELIELLFRQPYTKGQFLVDEGIAERQTAAEYLRELEKIGILENEKVGRENLYLNRSLFDLLSK
jgi:Fic family protein